MYVAVDKDILGMCLLYVHDLNNSYLLPQCQILLFWLLTFSLLTILVTTSSVDHFIFFWLSTLFCSVCCFVCYNCFRLSFRKSVAIKCDLLAGQFAKKSFSPTCYTSSVVPHWLISIVGTLNWALQLYQLWKVWTVNGICSLWPKRDITGNQTHDADPNNCTANTFTGVLPKTLASLSTHYQLDQFQRWDLFSFHCTKN